MGRGTYLGEVLSLSGIMKIMEFMLVFTALIVHRKGDMGKYVFFGTDELSLQPTDEGVDVENVGNGTLVAYAIISPILLICYALDGQRAIQILFLETVWNFIGCCLFLGTGIKTVIVWHMAKQSDEWAGRPDYATRYSAGLALGSLCIILGLLYFVDFCVSWSARKSFKAAEY